MTVEKMLDETQINRELFMQNLVGLLKNKVLKCSGFDTDVSNQNLKETDIEPSYIVNVDEHFKRFDIDCRS